MEKDMYEHEFQLMPGDIVEATPNSPACELMSLNSFGRSIDTSKIVAPDTQIYAIVFGELIRDFYFEDGFIKHYGAKAINSPPLFKEGTTIVQYLANGFVGSINTLKREDETLYHVVDYANPLKIRRSLPSMHIGEGLEKLAECLEGEYIIPSHKDMERLRKAYPSVYQREHVQSDSEKAFDAMMKEAAKRQERESIMSNFLQSSEIVSNNN